MPPVAPTVNCGAKLRRYGYYQEASTTRKFISLVIKEFEKHRTLPKMFYSCDSDSQMKFISGYSFNGVALVGPNAVLLIIS